jgi:single-stranded DNA-binding protein
MSYIEAAVLVPVERHTQTGKRYVTLTVVVRDKNDAEWVNVSAFEEVADDIPLDLTKGERLYVKGKARLSRWTAKDGQPRVNFQVTASRVQVLDRIGRNGAQGEARTISTATSATRRCATTSARPPTVAGATTRRLSSDGGAQCGLDKHHPIHGCDLAPTTSRPIRNRLSGVTTQRARHERPRPS